MIVVNDKAGTHFVSIPEWMAQYIPKLRGAKEALEKEESSLAIGADRTDSILHNGYYIHWAGTSEGLAPAERAARVRAAGLEINLPPEIERLPYWESKKLNWK